MRVMSEERRCTAHSKRSGEQCGQIAIRGGRVCQSHGGRAPQVKMAAEARIQALVDPAITELTVLIRSADSDSVKLSAIKDVLDRAGYKPTEKRETKLDGSLKIAEIRQALGLSEAEA